MWPALLIAIYCLLVAAASLVGGLVPTRVRLSHTNMQAILSFVGGLVLGVGLLHLLPHSAAETGSLDLSVGAALTGLLTMFLLIRIFQVHQHGAVEPSLGDPQSPLRTAAPIYTEALHHEHGHDHACSCDCAPADVQPARDGHDFRQDLPDKHQHDPSAAAYALDVETCAAHRHTYSWIGLGVGLALHTLIDGVALAASVAVEAQQDTATWHLLGLGTFLAILLHKPLDAMSITSVMAAGGWSKRTQTIVNLSFATMCALGAAGFYLGIRLVGEQQQLWVGIALGFAAGVFLCISLSDILPEVSFHAHDRFKLTTALLLGVALAYGIGFIEPAHQHSHEVDQSEHFQDGLPADSHAAHDDHDHD